MPLKDCAIVQSRLNRELGNLSSNPNSASHQQCGPKQVTQSLDFSFLLVHKGIILNDLPRLPFSLDVL